MVLAANKCDLELRDRGVPDDVGISEFAQREGFVPKWVKTSALNGQGIKAKKAITLVSKGRPLSHSVHLKHTVLAMSIESCKKYLLLA